MPDKNFVMVVWVLGALTFLLLSITITLLVARFRKSVRARIELKGFKQYEQTFLRFISGEDIAVPKRLHGNTQARNTLVDWGRALTGNEPRRILRLYDILGFMGQDLRLLKSGNLAKQARALNRCRSLRIELPDEAWRVLLRSTDTTFLWAAMEFLIEIKGAKSIGWIFSFVNSHRDIHSGVIQHLLSCLASKSPEALIPLLQYTDNTKLAEMTLRTLAIYPQAKAEDFILARLTKDTHEETYIAAIKALGAMPSKNTISVFDIASDHEHWVVRMEIARALLFFDEPVAERLLRKLLTDPAYNVRLVATKTLINHSKFKNSLSQEILNDPDHPSFRLLRFVKHLEEVA